jgi:tRNA(fMet)-specific endonuclease VapC
MKRYVLDTDHLTLCQENHPAVIRNVCQHVWADLAITVVSAEEQLSGWYTQLRRARRTEDLARAYQKLTLNLTSLIQFQILPFDGACIARYEQLKAQKLNIGKMDLRIAAIVLEKGGILVTRNRRDFQRVPGLILEDWTS